tara:strand:- start:383 stop:994 length:612 start_codon:yes stop_codon:yes gene_type:complete
MKAFKHNNKNNFLAGWYINKKVCKDLINFFEKTEKTNGGKKGPGTIGKYGGGIQVDLSIKDSLDLPLIATKNKKFKEVNNYLSELQKVLNNYKDKYIYSNLHQHTYILNESFNIQKYKKNGGFKKFHYERNGNPKFSNRHLVFMTYLNNIKDKGETEWYYQKLKVKPETGLTLIWPVDWMFTHRGIPSEKEIKYIVTGWYSYV